MANRQQRRAAAAAGRAQLKTALSALSENEDWRRFEGVVGFEYRHVLANGEKLSVKGIWPRWAARFAAIAFVVGFAVGLVVK